MLWILGLWEGFLSRTDVRHKSMFSRSLKLDTKWRWFLVVTGLIQNEVLLTKCRCYYCCGLSWTPFVISEEIRFFSGTIPKYASKIHQTDWPVEMLVSVPWEESSLSSPFGAMHPFSLSTSLSVNPHRCLFFPEYSIGCCHCLWWAAERLGWSWAQQICGGIPPLWPALEAE